MSTYRPDISQLFNAAFGVTPITYKVDNQAPNNGLVNYQSIPVKTYEAAKKMSWMGTPIMFPMKFKGGYYNRYSKAGRLIANPYQDFDLPPATIVDFRRAKNITKTNVLGSTGTVKEIYGFDDWQIRIRGLCLDTPNLSAIDQYKALLRWEEIADSIEVLGELFLDKSIFSITIEDIDFKQAQGKENVIPFEITASSDEPLEFSV
ncbi:DUF6046 domain-containing protein [Formosa sp. A9]|uniref:DUF6046 domain-containing protein n=1 Tax=Formosa sp. A9 TaxID=3442641 RepID=UPI003EBE91B2